MSYILEALKKVEQERAIGQVPGIASGHEPRHRTGFSRWLWVVIAVLVLNALLLVWALWPRFDSRLVQGLVDKAPDPGPPVVSGFTQAAPQAGKPVVAAVKPTAPAKPAAPLDNRPPVVLRPLPPLSEPVPVAAAEVPVADPVLKSLPVEKIPPNDNLPVWPQVSSQLFQQINSGLHLDVHVYSELPAQRFVLINMQKYHEGEKLQEGPVVDEITANDVILSYRGQRFRVQSQ
jgi:general secretion pathway protein B